jgi:hypothetical protein
MDRLARLSRPHKARQLLWLLLAVVFSSSTVLSADEAQLVPVEDVSTAFAGDMVTVEFRVKSEQPVDGTLQWSHSAQQRTLNRGEADVRQSDDGPAASFDLQLTELRDGVIFRTQLTTEFVPRGETSATAQLQRSLWLFPRNPVAGRSAWAEKLELELFDPEGQTLDALKSIELPFQQSRSLSSALPDESSDIADRHRVLLIGEGASLAKGTLIDTAVEAAQAGRRVIVLAPEEGTFFMPGFDDDSGQKTGELRLVRQSVITEFDKRLDAKAWPGASNAVPSRGLRIGAVRGRMHATVSDNRFSWPWLELRYPDSGGVLIFCGFRIVEHWDSGPTPRYLLVRILESLSGSDSE